MHRCGNVVINLCNGSGSTLYTRRRSLGLATSSRPAEIMNSPMNSRTRTTIGGSNQYHSPSSIELLNMFQ